MHSFNRGAAALSLLALASLPQLACSSGDHAGSMPSCTTPEYVVAMSSDSPRPSSEIPFQLEGDRLLYSDGRAIFAIDGGAVKKVGAGPADPIDPRIIAFWVEPTRFVVAGYGVIWSAPRDGSPSTPIVQLPGETTGVAYAKEDAVVYTLTAPERGPAHVLRVPLAGGAVVDLGTVPPTFLAKLYVDATKVYVAGFYDDASNPNGAGDAVYAVAKDGSGVTPVPIDDPQEFFVLGWDGAAFYVDAVPQPGVEQIDRVTPDGARSNVWSNSDVRLDSTGGFDAASDLGYVTGLVGLGTFPPNASLVRLAHGGPASVVACDSDKSVLYDRPIVGMDSVYVQVSDDSQRWGIVRFAR
jgi:hypothetical protein